MNSAHPSNLKTYEINVMIVQNVKKHPVLYDPTLPEYEKKIYSREAWESIAKATNVSVDCCKARWRNLWLSFLRYQRMKKDPSAQIKPYYLQQEMSFLLPYIRSRPDRERSKKRQFTGRSLKTENSSGTPQVLKFSLENEEGQDIEIEYLEDGCEQQEEVIVSDTVKREHCISDGQTDEADQQDYIDHQEYTDDTDYTEHHQEYAEHYQEYTEHQQDYTDPHQDYVDEQQDYVDDTEHHPVFEEHHSVRDGHDDSSKKYYEIVSTTDDAIPPETNHDPDWDFMRSFLPDIRKMTPGQKIRFKMSICSAIHEILYS
ncbi:uncharacterized protein LOC129788770 [Lutzomyia longipalpis]|uniref:uncharacterized protein LOC129788770 n=1 Tax=Lutzomyia longipalpis TaxID=7200 RepID=UPI0024839FDB|nr:uncharacterized protein LOC129788770 [Lutzomyia longipalpis]